MGKDINKVSTELIYPASERLINKHTKQKSVVVVETAAIYDSVTKPLFIDKLDMSHCNWMYSILDGEKE